MNATLIKSAFLGTTTMFACTSALAGSITGKIDYEGVVPPVLAKPIDASSDPNCVHSTQDDP